MPLLLVTGAALAFSLLQDEEYRAETSLLFRDTGPVIASAEPSARPRPTFGSCSCRRSRIEVEARLGGELDADVDVVAEAESNLATVTVVASSAEAARIANVYAQEFIELREEDYRQGARSETRAVKEQLAGLRSAELGGREGQDLQTQLQNLELAAADSSSPVVQIDRAKPPADASAPKPVQNTVIGAIVGLALGLALAIALERRDRRVRDPRFMEYVLGGRSSAGSRAAGRWPAPGAAPGPAGARGRGVPHGPRQPPPPARAAGRPLADRDLGDLGRGQDDPGLEPGPDRGRRRSRVLLIEADLRRPSLAKSLEANGAAGLSELLASDQAQLQDLIQPVDFQGAYEDGAAEGGSVDVLFAGSPPANPAELLDSERMQAILEVIPDRYDLVVVDTPPTIVSDAMPILEYVGGVIVVGRLGLSTDESLLGLREQLDHLDAPTLGVVVNGDVKSSDAYYYYPSKN